MDFSTSLNRQGSKKFKEHTLNLPQNNKMYNPTFVKTSRIDHSHVLIGDELRKYENKVALQTKKEVHAKYTDLLKSKVKKSKIKNVSDSKSSQLGHPTEVPANWKKAEMKEIFKNSVYANPSNSSLANDLLNTSSGKKFLSFM